MTANEVQAAASATPDQVLDTSALNCPMPLLKTKLALSNMEVGSKLLVVATDSGSARDIPHYISRTDHRLLDQAESEGRFRFLIERG